MVAEEQEACWDPRLLHVLRDVVADAVAVVAAIRSVHQLLYKPGIDLKPSQT